MSTFEPTPAAVRFLAGRFGLPAATGRLTPAARGSMGRIWQLEVDGGSGATRYAVKEFFWGAGIYAEQEARVESAFRDAAIAAGIRAPRSIPTTDGDFLVRMPAQLGGVIVRLSTWVSGRTLLPADRGRAAYLGDTLGRLHRLQHPTDAEPIAYFTTPPPHDRWDELLDQTARFRHLVPAIADRLPGSVNNCRSLADLVDRSPQHDLICSHRDVGPPNVMVDSDSGSFTLIDWDEVGPISPSRELAAQLWTWHMHQGRVDTDAIRQTVRAYRDAGGTGGVSDLSSFSLRISNDLNYLADEISAAMDTTQPTDMREHAEQEALRFLADLPTESTLDDIVDAARIL